MDAEVLTDKVLKGGFKHMKDPCSPFALCKVCGDRASGRHYGVLTCDGCRGFFKRSVRRNIEYSCKFQEQCIVDLKRRNQCQFCRYQRCLIVGMNRHSVQHERIPRRQKSSHSNVNLNMDDNNKANVIQIAKRKSETQPQNVNNQSKFTQHLHLPNFIQSNSLECPKENRPPKKPLKKNGYSIESLLEVAKKERTICADQHEDQSTSPLQSPSIIQGYREKIHETLHQVLQNAFFWPNSVPTFRDLPNGDKTKLIDEGWAELFMLGLIESNFSLAVLSGYLRSSINMFKSKEEILKIEKFELVLQKLKSLIIDPNEMIFLKAIAVFKPHLQALVMRQHIENLQDQAQVMLGDYTRQYYPGNNARFGKLILSLQLLRSVDQQMLRQCLQQPLAFQFSNLDLFKPELKS